MCKTQTVCSQSCNMMPLCCLSILLLCLSAEAENVSVYRDAGENVTLECSSAACPDSAKGFSGMYLYHDSTVPEEVLYYYPKPGSTDKITPRERYINRIQTNGSLKKHSITIGNLTVDDSGFYRCVYVQASDAEIQCSIHTLFVRGVAPCSRSEEVSSAQASEKSQPLVLIIVAACAISTLVTVIFILLIVLRVKQWVSSRRRRTRVPPVPTDYFVYEVMTKGGFQPLAAPEQPPPSSCDSA